MEELTINTKSALGLVEFLSEWRDLADQDLKIKVDELIDGYDEGKELDLAELAQFVEDFAWQIWPVRFALNSFFKTQGAAIEWDRVLGAVRHSTAHLMQRFKQTTDCHGIDELFNHDDFELSFKEAENHEIDQVRHHVRTDYWRQHPETLSVFIKEGEVIREGYKSRLTEFQSIMRSLPELMSEELRSKISSIKDKILYRGEHVPLEVMDEELIYYREQKEIPIEE